jgi:hypothetical protein
MVRLLWNLLLRMRLRLRARMWEIRMLSVHDTQVLNSIRLNKIEVMFARLGVNCQKSPSTFHRSKKNALFDSKQTNVIHSSAHSQSQETQRQGKAPHKGKQARCRLRPLLVSVTPPPLDLHSSLLPTSSNSPDTCKRT